MINPFMMMMPEEKRYAFAAKAMCKISNNLRALRANTGNETEVAIATLIDQLALANARILILESALMATWDSDKLQAAIDAERANGNGE